MLMLSDVLPFFSGNKAALARALGITRQAVNNWPDDAPIPAAQALKLRYEILPDELREPPSSQQVA